MCTMKKEVRFIFFRMLALTWPIFHISSVVVGIRIRCTKIFSSLECYGVSTSQCHMAQLINCSRVEFHIGHPE